MKKWNKREAGVDIAEYGLMLAGLAILTIAGMQYFAGGLTTFFTGLGQYLMELGPKP